MFFYSTPHYVLLSFVTAFVATFLMCPWWIAFSRSIFCSKVRPDTPQQHQRKNGTPTMGGIFIIGMIGILIAMWCDSANGYCRLILCCFALFGALGAYDDWYKIKFRVGISARQKFILQILCASAVIGLWFFTLTVEPYIFLVPGIKIYISPVLFFIWAVFVLIATSNAVNITDGLDGLVIGSLVPNFVVTTFLCFYNFVLYQGTEYISVDFMQLGIISVICCGVLIGFFWFNTYPAAIFMGDVGSLAFGAVLALMMLIVKRELLLIVTGGIFVTETASVIIQILWYKKYGTRLFKMAPFHHHLELLEFHESQITVRFSIISWLLCISSLFFIY